MRGGVGGKLARLGVLFVQSGRFVVKKLTYLEFCVQDLHLAPYFDILKDV